MLDKILKYEDKVVTFGYYLAVAMSIFLPVSFCIIGIILLIIQSSTFLYGVQGIVSLLMGVGLGVGFYKLHKLFFD